MTVVSELTIEQRVAAGVAWLDENRPAWEETIDLDRLNLRDACLCVLGQVYGGFWKVVEGGRFAEDEADAFDIAAGMGFAGYDDERRDVYYALDEGWRRVIESRRAES